MPISNFDDFELSEKPNLRSKKNRKRTICKDAHRDHQKVVDKVATRKGKSSGQRLVQSSLEEENCTETLNKSNITRPRIAVVKILDSAAFVQGFHQAMQSIMAHEQINEDASLAYQIGMQLGYSYCRGMIRRARRLGRLDSPGDLEYPPTLYEQDTHLREANKLIGVQNPPMTNRVAFPSWLSTAQLFETLETVYDAARQKIKDEKARAQSCCDALLSTFEGNLYIEVQVVREKISKIKSATQESLLQHFSEAHALFQANLKKFEADIEAHTSQYLPPHVREQFKERGAVILAVALLRLKTVGSTQLVQDIIVEDEHLSRKPDLRPTKGWREKTNQPKRIVVSQKNARINRKKNTPKLFAFRVMDKTDPRKSQSYYQRLIQSELVDLEAEATEDGRLNREFETSVNSDHTDSNSTEPVLLDQFDQRLAAPFAQESDGLLGQPSKLESGRKHSDSGCYTDTDEELAPLSSDRLVLKDSVPELRDAGNCLSPELGFPNQREEEALAIESFQGSGYATLFKRTARKIVEPQHYPDRLRAHSGKESSSHPDLSHFDCLSPPTEEMQFSC